MKAVILAGGYGTRISEETHLKPKPMVEIGGKPILWHIMKIYSYYGINDFVICCGYKGFVIKEYFANYCLHNSDVTFDMRTRSIDIHQDASEPWRVTLVDTGESTLTGGRLKRVRDYVGDSRFCLTYGDGLADINIRELIRFHEMKSAMLTVTAVQPPGRFGSLTVDANGFVDAFIEKPQGDGGWVNGGFFVIEPQFFEYLSGDNSSLEREPLERVAADGRLAAYKHSGFWQAMDTLRDNVHLEELWRKNRAPWSVWTAAPKDCHDFAPDAVHRPDRSFPPR